VREASINVQTLTDGCSTSMRTDKYASFATQSLELLHLGDRVAARATAFLPLDLYSGQRLLGHGAAYP